MASNIADVILTVLDLVERGALSGERIKMVRDHVTAMKAAGRDPTSDEWGALFVAIDANERALHEAADKLTAQHKSPV